MCRRIVLVCLGIAMLPCIAFAQPAPNGDVEAFAMRIEAKLEQMQKDAESRLTALEEKVQALSDTQASSRQAIEQFAKTDSDGKYFPRLDTSHEPTRNEIRRAIADVAPKVGTVVLRNPTNSTLSVAVNGRTVDVLAKSKRTVSVPYRPFEVRSCSNHKLNWDFSYPQKEAFVNLVPVSRSEPLAAYFP